MANVKGTAIKASLGYIEKTSGEDGVRRVLAKLDRADRETLQGIILVSNWYEFQLLVRLMKAAEGVALVPPGSSLAREMGRYSADFGLKSIYRVFIKLADPTFVITKATKIYSTYYDSGSLSLTDLGTKRVTGRLTGFDEPDRLFCERLLGFMVRSIEISGAQRVKATHDRCAAHGDAYCEFKFTWE